ncbi:39S ribosomal protein L27, mitochondrial isoform X2 [Heptranchias perlo]|uniref:39S ribosomal protein L27, mitochondrial isoform X2 n=1 Tax=Heptranchias perlo TaxID=212740 RepID=UPI00355A4EEC
MRLTLARAGRTGIIAALQKSLLLERSRGGRIPHKKKSYYSGKGTTEFKETAASLAPLSRFCPGSGVNEMAALKSLNGMITACARTGDFVHTGNILATQRLIRWHPGANVGMGRNKTLFALEDGTVRYTKEVYVPPPRSLETMKIISRLPKGAVLYKTFINVVPTKQEGCFKLVDML